MKDTARAHLNHRSRTRVVSYAWGVPGGFDETRMDRLLYEARAAGVISMHDAGRGQAVWFEGPPGPALRELRERVLEIAGPTVRPNRRDGVVL